MKPILLSVIFLAAIIAGSLITISYIRSESQALTEQLDTLEKQVESEKWEQAAVSIKNFKKKWVKVDHVWSMLIDHYEIDYINMNLGELEAFIRNEDKSNAMAKISSLQLLVEHIPEKEHPSLKNLF